MKNTSSATSPRGAISLILLHLTLLIGNLCIIAANAHRTVTVTANLNLSSSLSSLGDSDSLLLSEEFVSARLSRSSVPLFISSIHTNRSSSSSSSTGSLFSNATGTLFGAILSIDELGNTTTNVGRSSIGVNLSLSYVQSTTATNNNGSVPNGTHECTLKIGVSTFQGQPYTSLLAAEGNETAVDVVCLSTHKFDALLEGQLLNSSSSDPLLGSFPIAAIRSSFTDSGGAGTNRSGYGLATASVSHGSIDGLVPVSAVLNMGLSSTSSIYGAAVASPLAMLVDGARLFGFTREEGSGVLFDAMGESTVHVVGRISRSSRGFLAAEASRSFISRREEEVSNGGSPTDVSASLPVLDLVEALLQGSERLSSPFRPLETVGYHSVMLRPTEEEGGGQGVRYFNLSSSSTSASREFVAAEAEVAVAPLHLLLGSFNVGVYVDGPSAVIALAFARREGDGDAGGGKEGDEQVNTINTPNKYRLEVFVHSIEQLLVEMDTHASSYAAAPGPHSPLPLVALSFITQQTHTRNLRRYLAINGERLSPVSDAEVLGMCGRLPFPATLPSAALQKLVRRFVMPMNATGQLEVVLRDSIVELTDENGRGLPSSSVALRDVDDLSSFTSPLNPSLGNLSAGASSTVVSFAFLSGAPLSPQDSAELVPQYPFHASVGTHTHKALFALCVLFLLAIVVGIVAAFFCEGEALAAWSCALMSRLWTERGNDNSSQLCPKCAAAQIVVNKNSVSESAEPSATAVRTSCSSFEAPRRGLWGLGRPNIPLQCRGPRDRTLRAQKDPFSSSSSAFTNPNRQKSKPYTCQQCGVLQEQTLPKEAPLLVRDAFAAEAYWWKNKPFLPSRLGAVVTLALVMLWSWQVQAVFYLTIWPDSSTEDESIPLESTRQRFEEFAQWAQYAALAFFPIPTSYATPLQIVTFNLWAILAASFLCCCAMWAMMWMDLRTTSTRLCLSYVHSLTAKEYFVQRLVDLKLFYNSNQQPPHHHSFPSPTSSVPKEIQQSRPFALLTNMQADMEGELARLEQGRASFQQRVVDTFLPEGFVGNNAFILDFSTVVDVCRDTCEGGAAGSSEHHQRRIAGREASSRQELLSAISIALAFEKQARLRARRYKRFMATAKKILEANESETEADASKSSSPPSARAASAPSVRRHESSGLSAAASTSSKGPRRQRGTSFNAGHSLSPERLINSQTKGTSAGSRRPPPPSEALIGESNLNGVGLATNAHLRHATTGRVYECVVRGVYRRNFRPKTLLTNDLSTRKADDSTSSSENDDNALLGAEDSLTPDQLFVPGGATSPVAVAAIRRRAAPRLWVFIEVLHLHQKAFAVFRADLSVFDMPFEKKPRPILRSPSRVTSHVSEPKAVKGNAGLSPRSAATAISAISTTKGLLDAITASTHFIDAAYFNVMTPPKKNNSTRNTMRGEEMKESTLTSNGSRGRRVVKVLFGSFVTLVTAWLIIPSLWWSVHILFSSTGEDRQSVHDNVLTCTWVTEVRYRPLMVVAATSMMVLWVSFFASILFWAIIRRNIIRKWDDDGFELGHFDHHHHQGEGSSARYRRHDPSAGGGGGGDDPLLQSISTGVRPSFACNGNETMYVGAADRKSGASAALSDPALEMRAVSKEPNYSAWYGASNKGGGGGKGKAMAKSEELAPRFPSTIVATASPEVHRHSLVSKVSTLLRILNPAADSVVDLDGDEEMATKVSQRRDVVEPDDLVVESASVSPLNPNVATSANIRNFFAAYSQSPTEDKRNEKDCWNASNSPNNSAIHPAGEKQQVVVSNQSAPSPMPTAPNNNAVLKEKNRSDDDAKWWAVDRFTAAFPPPPPPRRRMLNQKDLTDLCDILSAFYRVSTPPLQSALRGMEVSCVGEQQQIELAVVDQREVMNAAVGATTAAALLGGSGLPLGTQESSPSTVFARAAPSSLPPKRSRQPTEACLAESTAGAVTTSASSDPLSREEDKNTFRGDFSSASASTIPLISPPPPPLISPVDVILAYGSALNDGREGSPAVLNLTPAPNQNQHRRSMSLTLENASFGGESSAFTPQTTSMPLGGHAGARFPLRNVILFGAGPSPAGAGGAISPRNPHLFVPSSTSRRASRGGGGFHFTSPHLHASAASSSMVGGHDHLHHRRRAEDPPPAHDEVAVGARLLFSPTNDGDAMNNSYSHSQKTRFVGSLPSFAAATANNVDSGGKEEVEGSVKMMPKRRRSDTVGPTTTTAAPLSATEVGETKTPLVMSAAASESAEDSGREHSPTGVFPPRQNDPTVLHVARTERASHRRASAVVFAPIPTEPPAASSSTHLWASSKLEGTAGPHDAFSSSVRSGGDVNSEHAYGVVSQSGSVVEKSDHRNSSSSRKGAGAGAGGEAAVTDKKENVSRLLSLALSPADLSATSVADTSEMARPSRHMPLSPTCKEGEGDSRLPLYVSAASGAHVLRPLLVVLPSVTQVLFSVMEAGRQGLSFDDGQVNVEEGDGGDEEIAGYVGPKAVSSATAALAFNARLTSVSMLDKLCSATITINLLPVTALEVAGEGGGIRVPGGGGGQQREAALNAAAMAAGGGDSTAHLQHAAQYSMIKSLLDSSGLANSPYRSAREALINSGAAAGRVILDNADKGKASRSGPEEGREEKSSPIARQKRLALQLLKVGVTETENETQNPASSNIDGRINNTLSADALLLNKRSVIVISPLTKRLHVLGAAATATPSENTRHDTNNNTSELLGKDAQKSSAQNASPLSPVHDFGFSPSSPSSSSEEDELNNSSQAENERNKDRKRLHAGVISILATVDGSSSDNAESEKEVRNKRGGVAVQFNSSTVVVRDIRDAGGSGGASTSNPLFPPSFTQNNKDATSDAQQKQKRDNTNPFYSPSEGDVPFEHTRPQAPETEDGCGAALEMDGSPAKAATTADDKTKNEQGNLSSPLEASPTLSDLLPFIYLKRVQPEALDRPFFEHYCHVLLSLPGISLPTLSWFLIASFVSICLSVMLPSVGLYAHRWLSGPHRFESNLKLETTPNGGDIDDVSSLTLTLGINALLQFALLSVAMWRNFVCLSADDATRSDLSSLPSSKRATIVAEKGRLIIITYTSIAAFGFAQCLNLLLGLETARRRTGGAVSTIIGLGLLSYEASAGVCWCITGFVFVLLMVFSVVR